MSKTLIEFKDSGQDFLVWEVDQDGVVTRSWPCQTEIWRGLKVTNMKSLKRDGHANTDFNGQIGTCRHSVIAAHPLRPVVVTVSWDGIVGYSTSTVRGKRASCTHDCQAPVWRLAEKVFPSVQCIVERLDYQPEGKGHSRWCVTPGDA